MSWILVKLGPMTSSLLLFSRQAVHSNWQPCAIRKRCFGGNVHCRVSRKFKSKSLKISHSVVYLNWSIGRLSIGIMSWRKSHSLFVQFQWNTCLCKGWPTDITLRLRWILCKYDFYYALDFLMWHFLFAPHNCLMTTMMLLYNCSLTVCSTYCVDDMTKNLKLWKLASNLCRT